MFRHIYSVATAAKNPDHNSLHAESEKHYSRPYMPNKKIKSNKLVPQIHYCWDKTEQA